MNKLNKVKKSRKCVDKEAKSCINGAKRFPGLVSVGQMGCYFQYSIFLTGFSGVDRTNYQIIY